MHAAIYAARPDVQAIVHAHPRYSTALATTRREIPPFHYMVAVAGGKNIRCAPYAVFGSEQIARNAVEALRDRKACLLANHGSIAVGPCPSCALDLVEEVEWLAAAARPGEDRDQADGEAPAAHRASRGAPWVLAGITGTGTCRKTSSMTLRSDIRTSHSEGSRITRWASTGCTNGFTSSGMT